MAVRVHGGMKRKGDDLPYLIHPIGVLALLVRWEADEDTCIAGLLHDAIEEAESDEQRATYRKEIAESFGDHVLEIVEGVTEQDKSLPWKERKRRYLKHLKEAPEESLLVSCADKTHNVASLVEAYARDGEEVWKRFNAIKQWKVWFIDQAMNILKERLGEPYTAELRGHVTELNALLSRSLTPKHRSETCYFVGPHGEKIVVRDPLFLELWDHCMLTEEEMESGVLEEDAAARAQEVSGERQETACTPPAPSATSPVDTSAAASPPREGPSDDASTFAAILEDVVAGGGGGAKLVYMGSKKTPAHSPSAFITQSTEGLPDDVLGYVEILESMSNLCGSLGSEDELCTSLADSISPLNEKQLILLSIYITDKLYYEIQFGKRTYDNSFYAYLDLLKRGVFDLMLKKQLPIAYLVAGTYIEPKKRMPMIAQCFRSAGFAVYSPEILWLDKQALKDERQALTNNDCLGLSYAYFLDSLRYKHEHCIFFTSPREDRSTMYKDFLEEFEKNETHLCLFREDVYSDSPIKLLGTLHKKYDLCPYTVIVRDNFYFQQEEEKSARYEHGQYSTLEEAESACKTIVDDWLLNAYKPGMLGVDLYQSYTCGGDDPFVMSPLNKLDDKFFSAWDYAKQRCKEICGE
ncbi:MAG: HD domain-containing protein [bacterium]